MLVDLAVHVKNVAQHRKQVFLDATDHAAVDERAGRCVVQLELHAPGLAHDVDFKIGVPIEDGARVVGFAAAVEHRQRAAAIQRIQAAARRIEQPVDFLLREVFEAAARRYPRVDSVGVLRRRRKCDVGAAHHQGLISIGMPTPVRNQTSTMSELLSAMQPSVQSLLA